MKTIDLFTVKNNGMIVMIPVSDMPISLNKLETNYMTLRSTDENNEYRGIDIKLVDVNPKSGFALFRVNDDDSAPTEFVIKAEDDPVVELKDDLGKEHHIFDNVSQYEINPDIKPGKLYSFQSSTHNERFLAIVQSVSKTKMSYTEMVPMVSVDDVPEKYKVSASFVTIDTSTAIPETLEKFSDYTVTELYDIDDWGIRIKEIGGRIHIKDSKTK